MYSREVIAKLVKEHIDRIKTAQSQQSFSPARQEYMKGQRQAYEQVESWLATTMEYFAPVQPQ